MGAKEKLNSVHIIGGLGMAGLLGLMTGSWAVFAVAGAVLIGAAIHSGEIRGKGGRR
jgi:hypothetical protein